MNPVSDLVPIDLATWNRPADELELKLLAQLDGSVLDIGCGPGRLTQALRARGVDAFGIDRAASAVVAATERGAAASLHNVFAGVPHEGMWRWALLMDGNIGIGGDPVRLLTRVHDVLRSGGGALVEVEGVDVPYRVGRIALRADGAILGHYPWSWVGLDDIGWIAAAANMAVERTERHGTRSFAWLRRP